MFNLPQNRTALRLAVLTSVETRHRYFANALHKTFNLVAAVYARPGYAPAAVDDSELTEPERKIVAAHFAERVRQEESFFGHGAQPITDSDCHALEVEPGRLNTPETVHFLRSRQTNVVAVFGTDLIKPPLLSPEWTMINMHLGLSPYYRGTATNFYPLLNEEPAFVGATIHKLDAGIDSGPIFCHAQPETSAHDQPHTIGCKAIAAGTSAMVSTLQRFEEGEEINGVAQWNEPGARVYFRRDYHPRQVVELYRKWSSENLQRWLATGRRPRRLVPLSRKNEGVNVPQVAQTAATRGG